MGKKKRIKPSGATSFRLSDRARKKLNAEASRLGMSQVKLLELLIDRYAGSLEVQIVERRGDSSD